MQDGDKIAAMKTLFTLWITNDRSAIKISLMLYKTGTTFFFLPLEFLSYLPNENFLFFFTTFIQFIVYVIRLLPASQDWDRLSCNMCPCIQWKLYFHNEELKTKFHVFCHLPSPSSHQYVKSIVSTFLSEFKTSFNPLLAFQFKTFLLPFPVLNFYSTKLINKLQDLGNMKQYLQNLLFTNLSVPLQVYYQGYVHIRGNMRCVMF